MTTDSACTGVYCLRNLSNGKVYVGSTCTGFTGRFYRHRKELNGGRHHSRHLQRAWNLSNGKGFIFSILERCDSDSCIEREQFWMDKLKCYNPKYGYNIRIIAESRKGVKASMSSRKKMSLSKKGVKVSEETKSKMRESQLQRWAKPGQREKQSIAMKGKRVGTENSRRLRSDAVKAMWKDPEKRAKRIAALSNAWQEEKTRRTQELADAWADPEKRRKRILKLRETRASK